MFQNLHIDFINICQYKIKVSNLGEFDVLVSARVGRSKQKEQYAVFYRKNKVEILVGSLNEIIKLKLTKI